MNRGQDLRLVIVILALVYLLASCAAAPVKPAVAPDSVQNNSMCPPDDVLFMTGAGPVGVPKGFFDQGEGANWLRMQEYERLSEEARKSQGL